MNRRDLGEKVVFLDRDGTVNKQAALHQYITKVEDVRLLEGVGNSINKLNQAGYKVIVVSNQRGISRGIFTREELQKVTERISDLLKKYDAVIDEYYYCTHNDGECECKKPQIGLFKQVEHCISIDKRNSYMIGDSETDMEAGIRYGATSIKLGSKCDCDYCCENLEQAVEWIMGRKVK